MSRKSSQAPSVSVIFAEPESSAPPSGSAAATLTPVASSSTSSSSASSMKDKFLGGKRSRSSSKTQASVGVAEGIVGVGSLESVNQFNAQVQNGRVLNGDIQVRHMVSSETRGVTVSLHRPKLLRSGDAREQESRGSWLGFGRKTSRASLATSSRESRDTQATTEVPLPLISDEISADPVEEAGVAVQSTPLMSRNTPKHMLVGEGPSLPEGQTERIVSGGNGCAEFVGGEAEGTQQRDISNTSTGVGHGTPGAAGEQSVYTESPGDAPKLPIKVSSDTNKRSWFSFRSQTPKVHSGTKGEAPSHEETSPEREDTPAVPEPSLLPVSTNEAPVQGEFKATTGDSIAPSVTIVHSVDPPVQTLLPIPAPVTPSRLSRPWFTSTPKREGEKLSTSVVVPPSTGSTSQIAGCASPGADLIVDNSCQDNDEHSRTSPKECSPPVPVEYLSSVPPSVAVEGVTQIDQTTTSSLKLEDATVTPVVAQSMLGSAFSRIALPFFGRSHLPLEKDVSEPRDEAPTGAPNSAPIPEYSGERKT